MEMKIVFPGNKKVHALYNGFEIATDQPAHGGGDESAPAPFDLFLASIGTCAGIYVLGFCRQRNLPVDGIELTQRMNFDPERRMIDRIDIEIAVPEDFPAKYHDALVNAASLCAVKKHIQSPPEFSVRAKVR